MGDKEEYLTPGQLAERWDHNIKTQTLATWRMKNKGPKWSKFEGNVLYKIKDVEAYEKLNQHGGKNA